MADRQAGPEAPPPQAAVLVISPHPDDDVIGMGGTMASMAARGTLVHVAYVAPGARSPRAFPMSNEEMERVRRKEAARAAKIVGAASVRFLDLEYPEAGADDGAWKEGVKRGVAQAIREFNPSEVYLPHPGEAHGTHQAVSLTVLELLSEKVPGPFPVYGYEIWAPIPKPDQLVDITDHLSIKRRAIRAHKTQVRDTAYEDGILGLNRYRGVFSIQPLSGRDRYAEAFVRL